MWNPDKLSALDRRTLKFLHQNPNVSRLLMKDVGADISRVETIINPVLDAPKRCEFSSFYIQAVSTGRAAFLVTNLPDGCSTHVTDVSAGWVVGRDATCAITVQDFAISRLHAAIGYRPDQGFYITDLSSTNGTHLNRRRLSAQVPRLLHDGDLLEFSNLRVEFFVSGSSQSKPVVQDTFSGANR
jgi:hypothetical protein